MLYQNLIYISDTVGLSIINVPLTWLLELNPAMKKARTLKKNGFSFQTQTVYYPSNLNLVSEPVLDEDVEIIQDLTAVKRDSLPSISSSPLPANIFSCKSRIWSDWVILWEYFAGKGNTQALALLRYLAIQGLESRIEPLLLINSPSTILL